MNEVLYNIWIGVKWFLGEFCILMLKAPMGILKDTFDTIEITWKLIALLISIAGAIIILIRRFFRGP